MMRKNIIIPKNYYWLFFYYIIGNFIQILVFVHSELGGARENDGYYSTFPIMVFETMLLATAAIYNLCILILTLIKYKYRLWHIPLINTIGICLILTTFIVSILNYQLYLRLIAPLGLLLTYLYNLFKLVSIYLAFRILKKLK